MIYQSFPLADVRPSRRFENFSELVSELFSPARCTLPRRPAAEFRCAVETADLGQLKVANVSSGALKVDRLPRHIAQIDVPTCMVKFQIHGHAVLKQRGREAQLSPGDFVLCSNAEPYHLNFDGPYQVAVLAIPTPRLKNLVRNVDDLLGLRMPAADPSCALVSEFVASVTGKIHQLPEAMVQRVENNILDLLIGAIATRCRTSGGERLSARQTLEAIKRYIENNLCDRSLGPVAIAHQFGISTRYLHKLFSSEPETVTRTIRSRRLNASCKMLLDPRQEHLSITEIALHWGFYDLSQMTHAYQERFGLSPSSMRARGKVQRPNA
ncbi:MAG: helix-turn-helix domain-containing protein [Pseudomonadota bacterium]